MTYQEKLRSPKWQRTRLLVLERDKYKCQYCSDKETELHVHHLSYKPNTDPWDYPLDNFLTLCKHCHKITEHLKGWIEKPVRSVKFQVGNYLAIYFFLSAGTVVRYTWGIDEGIFTSGGVMNSDELKQLITFKKVING